MLQRGVMQPDLARQSLNVRKEALDIVVVYALHDHERPAWTPFSWLSLRFA